MPTPSRRDGALARLRWRVRIRLSRDRETYETHWNPRSLSQARQLINVDEDARYFEEAGRQFADRILALLNDFSDKVVLDLGCGIGRIAGRIAPRCKLLLAVDLSEPMLEFARESLASLSNVRFIRSSPSSLPSVDDRSVDVLYSVLVLQHLEREDAFSMLREIRRVLRDGGVAYLTFPNLLHDANLEAFINYVDDGEVANKARARFYVPTEVDRLIRAAGFSEVGLSDDLDNTTIVALCR